MLENSQKAAVVELREGEMSGGEAGGDWGLQEDHTGCGQDGPLESPFLSPDTQGVTRQSQQEVGVVRFSNRCRSQRKTADLRGLRGVSAECDPV